MDYLTIRNLTRFFGGLAAVIDLDMRVDQGQLFGLIGPNGAGKSTVLNMIGGTIRPSQGEIVFNGNPIVVQEIGRIALDINKKGTSILLVEQNARLALRLAHRGYVLETGNLALEGKCEDLLTDARVKKAYLGQ